MRTPTSKVHAERRFPTIPSEPLFNEGLMCARAVASDAGVEPADDMTLKSISCTARRAGTAAARSAMRCPG